MHLRHAAWFTVQGTPTHLFLSRRGRCKLQCQMKSFTCCTAQQPGAGRARGLYCTKVAAACIRSRLVSCFATEPVLMPRESGQQHTTTGPKHRVSPAGKARRRYADRNLKPQTKQKKGAAGIWLLAPNQGDRARGCPNRTPDHTPIRAEMHKCAGSPASGFTALLWSLLRVRGPHSAPPKPPAQRRPARYIRRPRLFTWYLSTRLRAPPTTCYNQRHCKPDEHFSPLPQSPSGPPVGAPSSPTTST